MTSPKIQNVHYHNAIKSTSNSAVYKPSTNIITSPITDQYTISDNIGKGKFAVVKKCINKTTGEVLAAKYIKKRRRGKSCREEILREVVMLEMALDHPRLVNLKEVFETPQELILITEYCAGGELFTECILEEKFNEADVRLLMSQILEGLVYLHEKNIVHLDLKPQNILLTEEFPRGSVKICDLGFACMVNTGEDIRDIIGTPDYVAPEVLNYDPLGLYTDMWSLGVLTYVMLTTCSPFAADEKNQTFCNITNVHLDFPDDLFADISPAAQDFIKKLLIAEPSERMTAKECLSHEWLYDIFHPSIKELPVVTYAHEFHAEDISDDSRLENGEIAEEMSGSVSEPVRVENVGDDGKGDMVKSTSRGKIKSQFSGMSVGDGGEIFVEQSTGLARKDSRSKIRNQVSEMSVTEGGEDGMNEHEYSAVFDDENIRLSNIEFTQSVVSNHGPGTSEQAQNNENCARLGHVEQNVDPGLEENVGSIKNAFVDISLNTDSTVSISECKSYDLDSGIGTCSESKSVESLNAKGLNSGRVSIELVMGERDESEFNLVDDSHGGNVLEESLEEKNMKENAHFAFNGPESAATEGDYEENTEMELDQANEEINVSKTDSIQISMNNNAIDAQSDAKRDVLLSENSRDHVNVVCKSPGSFGDVQTSPVTQAKCVPRSSVGNIDDSINSMQLGERHKRGMCNENNPSVSGSCGSKDEDEYEFISVSKRVRSIETANLTACSPPFSPKIQRSPRIGRHSRSYPHQHH